jgi:hypothetical protein
MTGSIFGRRKHRPVFSLHYAFEFDGSEPARPLNASRTFGSDSVFACSDTRFRHARFETEIVTHIGPKSYCFDSSYQQDYWRIFKFRNARTV